MPLLLPVPNHPKSTKTTTRTTQANKNKTEFKTNTKQKHCLARSLNQGHFVPPDWVVPEPLSPQDFVELAKQFVDAGANAVGGCCGFGPEHIAALAAWASQRTAAPNTKREENIALLEMLRRMKV